MTNRLFSIGECMVEMAPAGDGHYRLGYAGDTFNTAWYLRQLAPAGVDIAYVTALGDDSASAKLRDFMKDSGITAAVQTIPETSVGLYMIETKEGERFFSYWRSASAARQMAADVRALPQMGKGDIGFFSGITVAILAGDGRQNLLRYLSEARERGARIVFDPNLRPRLWEDGDTMRHWITEAARVSDMVLPSHEDEADHFGDANIEATAQRYLDLGCQDVVVKDGPGPVLYATPNGSRDTVVPERVETVVDTTAAGDSFNAGLLASLMAGGPMTQAIAEGCALSARVIQAPGALVALD